MPELPEIELYLAALRRTVVGKPLESVRLRSVSLLKTFDPPLSAALGRTVHGVSRIGKRIVFELGDGLHLVLHLMVTGRLRWKPRGAGVPGRVGLAAFDFPDGTLLLTEAGTKKKAQLHLVYGDAALAALDRGGIEPLDASLEEFAAALRRENRTLKRALTDPRLVSGIGNAHSDEILWRARLSPLQRTAQLGDDALVTLYEATRASLTEWTERLQAEAGGRFPDKVTAFHPAMAVHGRFGEPCPRCGRKVQRIVRADNEINYCPSCQTGGHVLKDRSLSRLLGDDWPATVDELD